MEMLNNLFLWSCLNTKDLNGKVKFVTFTIAFGLFQNLKIFEMPRKMLALLNSQTRVCVKKLFWKQHHLIASARMSFQMQSRDQWAAAQEMMMPD